MDSNGTPGSTVPEHKTLAVLRIAQGAPVNQYADRLPGGPQQSLAFVSGANHGDSRSPGASAEPMPQPPEEWNAAVGTGVRHNSIHAEMHAMTYLHQLYPASHAFAGGYALFFELFVDKPPCGRGTRNCEASLPLALADLHERGVHVAIYYMAEGEREWTANHGRVQCH